MVFDFADGLYFGILLMTFLWILWWFCSNYDFAFDFVFFDAIFLWFWCDFENYLQNFLLLDILDIFCVKINYFDINKIESDKNVYDYEYSYVNII